MIIIEIHSTVLRLHSNVPEQREIFRILCSLSLLQVWGTFSGFLGFQDLDAFVGNTPLSLWTIPSFVFACCSSSIILIQVLHQDSRTTDMVSLLFSPFC